MKRISYPIQRQYGTAHRPRRSSLVLTGNAELVRRRDTGVGAGGVCAGSDCCVREEGADRGEPCGLGAVRDAVLRRLAAVDDAGGSGGVCGEQGAVLGGAELGWGFLTYRIGPIHPPVTFEWLSRPISRAEIAHWDMDLRQDDVAVLCPARLQLPSEIDQARWRAEIRGSL
jgi:hypothetical protein